VPEVQVAHSQERKPREAGDRLVPQELSGSAGPEVDEGLIVHVGFVGTGNMGRPMATNVLKAGHQLTVWDLRREATRDLENLGATRAADLAALEPPPSASRS